MSLGALTLGWILNPSNLNEVEGLMEEGLWRGYQNFNIKIARDLNFDIALAKAVRRRSSNSFPWVDANGGYDPKTALKAGPRLADAGGDILEAPVKPNQISSYQVLRKQGALPILMDEGVVSPVDLHEFKHFDGVAMKHSQCGRLLSSKASD